MSPDLAGRGILSFICSVPGLMLRRAQQEDRSRTGHTPLSHMTVNPTTKAPIGKTLDVCEAEMMGRIEHELFCLTALNFPLLPPKAD